MKQFAIYLDVLLLVVECYGMLSVAGNALLDIPCMIFQRMCVVHVIQVCINVFLP